MLNATVPVERTSTVCYSSYMCRGGEPAAASLWHRAQPGVAKVLIEQVEIRMSVVRLLEVTVGRLIIQNPLKCSNYRVEH